MDAIRSFLAGIGLPRGDLNELPDSPKRFPDGAQYRIEIPSTEGPRCLEAVLAEAERLDVRVQRVSQGSGVFMQTDDELDEMARLAAEARVEVSLFARPNAAWGLSATARAHQGFGAANLGHSAAAAKQGLGQRGRPAQLIAVRFAVAGLIGDDVLEAFTAAQTEIGPPARICFGDLFVGGPQIGARAFDLRIGGISGCERLPQRERIGLEGVSNQKRCESGSKQQRGTKTVHGIDSPPSS